MKDLTKWIIFVAAMMVAVILVAWLFPAFTTQLDPIREFFGPDGSLRIHGHVSGEFVSYLQHGPPVSNVVRFVVAVDRPGGTMSFRETSYDTTASVVADSASTKSLRTPSLSEFIGGLLAPFRIALITLFDLVTGDASAACTGGACFWVGGTGNFSDGTHWSLTSGGAACACTPGATDTVTFDASSGAGTATQNNATFTSGAVNMGAAATLTIAGSTNVWNVAGNWTENGNFSIGTSTVTFIATNTLSTANLGGAANFYNLTVGTSFTTTAISTVGISNVLTANGTYVIGIPTGGFLFILNNAGIATPIVLGAGGAITSSVALANFGSIYLFTQAGSVIQIPGGNYATVQFIFSPANAVAGFGVEFRIMGNLTAYSFDFAPRTGAQFFVNSQTFNVTLNIPAPTYNAIFATDVGANVRFGIQATSGTWTVGGMSITAITDHLFYVKFGASNWTELNGTWTNSGTDNGTDWSSGTGTFTFTVAQNATMTFGGTRLNVAEFNNLTFDASAAVNVTYNMGAALIISGTLSVRNGFTPKTTTLDVTPTNYTITADIVALTQQDNVGIINARGGTINTRSWNAPKIGYNPITAQVVFSGVGTIIGKNSINLGDFWNIVIGAGATTTIDNSLTLFTITNVLTVNGTLRAGSPNVPYLQTTILDTSGVADMLVLGVGADISLSGYIVLRFTHTVNTTFNVPGGTYQNLAVQAQTLNVVTANQTGSVATNQTPGAQCDGTHSNCQMIMNGILNNNPLVYNTNGFSINVGTLFFGDVAQQSVIFNAASSTITTRGFAPLTTSVVNLQTATVNANPSYLYTPVAWYSEQQSVVNAGSATINVAGKLRLWPINLPGDNAHINAQSATFTITTAGGGSPTSFGNPGDVSIDEAGYYIDFGSSTWTVPGNWTNLSTNPLWLATNAAQVNFNGTATQTIANNNKALPKVALTSTAEKDFTQSFASASLTNTVAVTAKFTASVTWTLLYPAVQLGGSVTNVLTLRSSIAGVRWNMATAGPTTAVFTNVKDSNVFVGSVNACGGTNVDSGNNVNWDFACVGVQTVNIAVDSFWLFFLLSILLLGLVAAHRIRERGE